MILMYARGSSVFQSIGNIFLKKGFLTEKQIDSILEYQKTKNMLFGQLAVSLKFLQEDHLLEVLSELYMMEPVALEFLYIDDETLNLLDREAALSCTAVVFSRSSDYRWNFGRA
jgi:hypothetical protein